MHSILNSMPNFGGRNLISWFSTKCIETDSIGWKLRRITIQSSGVIHFNTMPNLPKIKQKEHSMENIYKSDIYTVILCVTICSNNWPKYKNRIFNFRKVLVCCNRLQIQNNPASGEIFKTCKKHKTPQNHIYICKFCVKTNDVILKSAELCSVNMYVFEIC